MPNLTVGKSELDVSTLAQFNGLVMENINSATYPSNVFNSPLSLVQQPIIGELYNTVYSTPATGPWTFTATVLNGNGQIVITNVDGTITLPLGSTVLPGFRMTFIQTVSSGAQVLIQGSDTIVGQNSISTSTCYTGVGLGEFVAGPSNGGGGIIWACDNCFASS